MATFNILEDLNLPDDDLDTLTASVYTVDDPEIRSVIRSQEWQDKAWALYDKVPEIRFAIEFFASAISSAKFIIGERQGSRIVANTDPRVQELGDRVLAMLRGKRHSTAQLTRLLVINIEVAGDVWLISDTDTDGNEFVEVFSSDEVKSKSIGGSLQVGRNVEGRFVEFRSDQSQLFGFKPHPKKSTEPTSNLQALISSGEIQLWLDRMHRSTARSQSHAGLLVAPSELTFKPAPDGAGSNAKSVNPGGDSLDKKIFNTFSNSIDNERAGHAVAPAVMRGAGEHLDKVRHINLHRPFDEHLPALTELNIRRIATGLNMPAEIVLGQGSLTHWSAWQSSAEFQRSHAKPHLEFITDLFTNGLLLPLLIEEGVDDPSRYCVWFDETAMVIQPNRTANALDAHKLGVISDASLRHHLGFTEEDAPTDEEQERRNRTPRTSEGVQTDRGEQVGIQPDNGEEAPEESGNDG